MSYQPWASLRASAPKGPRWYIESDSKWSSYLRTAADVDGGDPHLCHVMRHTMEGLRSKDQPDGPNSQSRQPLRFPWVTPVIGSGCAGSLSPKQEIAISVLPATLAASCSGRDLPDGLGRDDLIYTFACAMVEARHSGIVFAGISDSASSAAAGLQTTARCVEATALLYRARHAALAHVGKPIREADYINLPEGIALQELHYSRLLPARTLLEALSRPSRNIVGSEVLNAYQDLFKTLLKKIPTLPHTEFKITARDLEALVEVAWQLMIAPLGIYPGWRDLMTVSAFTSFEEELKPDFSVLDTRQARPRFATLTGLAPELKRVRVIMGTATKIASTEFGERTRFFDALANVLKLQRDLRNTRKSGPFTSAFVTSFDLELERALARQGADFTVLVPYYLAHGKTPMSADHIAPIWLATYVKSSEVVIGDDGCWTSTFDDEGNHVSGFKPRWRLASITKNDDPLVVVRLVGSPLMPKALMGAPDNTRRFVEDLDGSRRKEDILYIGPELRDEYDQPLSEGLPKALRETQHLEISTPIRLDPALVIDEYSGLHHIKSSWTSTFPNDLTQADNSSFRYWCGAGLQLDDSLIRLLTAAYVEPMPTERSTSGSSGAVVNRNFALPQADFLRWQGFAPVKDDYRVLTPELEHLAAHLDREISDLLQRKPGDPDASGESFPYQHMECEIPFPIVRADLIDIAGNATADDA